MRMSDSDDRVKALLTTGGEIAGGAAGAAIGFLAAGPAAAAGASVAGVMIAKATTKLLGEIVGSSLSRGETIRVGGTAAYAIAAIAEFLEQGREPRDDGFFVSEMYTRSAAEELFDGVLLES